MNEVEHHYGEIGRHDHGGSSSQGTSAAGAATKAAQAVRGKLGKAYEDASDWASDRYGDASEWASDRYEDAARTATYARRRSVVGAGRARQNIERLAEDNPVMIGVVGLAAGMLIGALLPTTRRENRLLGPYADEARDQGLRYARDLAEQGRHFVEESLERKPGRA